ncbi:hypothetical protein NDU88_002975 [Pleurodeles waltl]|uniref:Uncharacterized protein n=1 Tax=Pleurodeles waltl TaxID=8319 RepID=A0AAV7WRG6_PLEWA|nr:hypothetical protein NDU88_002975 [Pleurodeles waltl]
MAISSLLGRREHINCSPGVCVAPAVRAPGVRKASAGSGAEPGPAAALPVGSSRPPSARHPLALSVAPAASLGVCGAQRSGAVGTLSPAGGAAVGVADVADWCVWTWLRWLRWRRRGIRPEVRQVSRKSGVRRRGLLL